MGNQGESLWYPVEWHRHIRPLFGGQREVGQHLSPLSRRILPLDVMQPILHFDLIDAVTGATRRRSYGYCLGSAGSEPFGHGFGLGLGCGTDEILSVDRIKLLNPYPLAVITHGNYV